MFKESPAKALDRVFSAVENDQRVPNLHISLVAGNLDSSVTRFKAVVDGVSLPEITMDYRRVFGRQDGDPRAAALNMLVLETGGFLVVQNALKRYQSPLRRLIPRSKNITIKDIFSTGNIAEDTKVVESLFRVAINTFTQRFLQAFYPNGEVLKFEDLCDLVSRVAGDGNDTDDERKKRVACILSYHQFLQARNILLGTAMQTMDHLDRKALAAVKAYPSLNYDEDNKKLRIEDMIVKNELAFQTAMKGIEQAKKRLDTFIASLDAIGIKPQASIDGDELLMGEILSGIELLGVSHPSFTYEPHGSDLFQTDEARAELFPRGTTRIGRKHARNMPSFPAWRSRKTHWGVIPRSLVRCPFPQIAAARKPEEKN